MAATEPPRFWAPRPGDGPPVARARPGPGATQHQPLARLGALPSAPRVRGVRPDGRGGMEPEPLGAIPSDPAPEAPPGPRRPALLIGATAGAVTALLTVLTLVATGVVGGGNTVIQREQAAVAPGLLAEGSIVDIARRVRPAIVTLTFSGGSGSGVIFRSDGYLLTNHHVVEGQSNVTVQMASGREFEGEVIGSDAETDIAVVRIVDGGEVPVATLGTAESLEVGQLAIAIGSPLGLQGGPSVTVGVISALGRTVDVPGPTDLIDMVQTDAPISPGSSGGALLNDRGAVIGITTAVAVSEVGAEGLGFATPIDIAKQVTQQIIDTGRVVHPQIGINGSTLSPDRAAGVGIDGGAVVSGVLAGSPAEIAGLRRGDIIVAIDGVPVRSMEALRVKLRSRSPGQQVTVSVLRGSDRFDIKLTLGTRD